MSCFSCVDEGVDAVELALAAQEFGEAHLGPLAVEVVAEVEQVGLEQGVVGVLVERRAPAEVDGARVHDRRRAARTTRRTPRRPAGTPGSAPRRWPSGTRAAVPAGRPGPRCPGPRRAGPAARRRRRPRPRPGHAGWRSTTPARRCRRPAPGAASGSDLEAGLGAELAQQGDVAPAMVAEVEVLADHHGAGAQAPDEHLGHELLGRLGGAALVEVHDGGDVEPGGGQQLQLLLEVGELRRGRLGPHDRRPGGLSNVTTADRASRSAARRRTSSMTARWPRWTPS